MKTLERLAIDRICSSELTEEYIIRVLDSNVLPWMVQLYLKRTVDEEILEKIIRFITIVFHEKMPRAQFNQQLESVAAFELLAMVSSHNSPNIQLNALLFLANFKPSTISNVTEKVAIVLLKFIQTIDLNVTSSFLEYISFIVTGNSALKEGLTRHNGVLIILNCIQYCIYKSYFRNGEDHTTLDHIKRLRPNVLYALVATPSVTAPPTYIANPYKATAQYQVALYPRVCKTIRKLLSYERWSGYEKSSLIFLVVEVLLGCGPDERERILSVRSSRNRCIAGGLIECLYDIYNRHDTVIKEDLEKAGRMQDLSIKLLLFFTIALRNPASRTISLYLEHHSRLETNFIDLLVNSESRLMREALFVFMCGISTSQHSMLKDVVRGWAAHPHFESIIKNFSSDPNPEISACAQQLISSTEGQPEPKRWRLYWVGI